MKVDFYYPPSPPEQAGKAAVEATALGYDGFFTAETQHDPFFPLALAAVAQPGLDLGTAIAVAFPRSPMVMAMTAWDLARMSQGRFILGLGTQVRAHVVRRFSTTWNRPVPRLREYIEALRSIWASFQDSTPLSYEGEFYRFSLITPFFNPGPIRHPDVPIYIAGVGPHLSRLAGELCQGFHVHPFHTTGYLDGVVLPAIRAGAERAGRTLDDIELATTVFVMTGETDSDVEQAMGAVRQQIASAIDLVVQITRLSDGTRKVTGITEITGMEGDTITMQDLFLFERTGIRQDGAIMGRFRATGIRPKASDRLAASGVHLPAEMFEHLKVVA